MNLATLNRGTTPYLRPNALRTKQTTIYKKNVFIGHTHALKLLQLTSPYGHWMWGQMDIVFLHLRLMRAWVTRVRFIMWPNVAIFMASVWGSFGSSTLTTFAQLNISLTQQRRKCELSLWELLIKVVHCWYCVLHSLSHALLQKKRRKKRKLTVTDLVWVKDKN